MCYYSIIMCQFNLIHVSDNQIRNYYKPNTIFNRAVSTSLNRLHVLQFPLYFDVN